MVIKKLVMLNITGPSGTPIHLHVSMPRLRCSTEKQITYTPTDLITEPTKQQSHSCPYGQ